MPVGCLAIAYLFVCLFVNKIAQRFVKVKLWDKEQLMIRFCRRSTF